MLLATRELSEVVCAPCVSYWCLRELVVARGEEGNGVVTDIGSGNALVSGGFGVDGGDENLMVFVFILWW